MEWHYGIDTQAHLGCLSANGNTIAVLGGGFEHIFPKENGGLFKNILDNAGLVISEYSPEIGVSPDNFRQRNRIVSGLSIGILVVEAAKYSGTGITINYARQQKKPIFSIPNSIDNKKGEGTNRLLKRDGILVTAPSEILEYFKLKSVHQIEINDLCVKKKKTIKEEYKNIYNAIQSTDGNINTIGKLTNINISELNSQLLMMELEGIIEALPGNKYKIVE